MYRTIKFLLALVVIVSAPAAVCQQQPGLTGDRYQAMDGTYTLAFNPLHHGWLPTSGVGQDEFRYAKRDAFHNGMLQVEWVPASVPFSREAFEREFKEWLEAVRDGSRGTNKEVRIAESRVQLQRVAGQQGFQGFGLLVNDGTKWRIAYVVRFTQATVEGRLFTFKLFYWNELKPLVGETSQIYAKEKLEARLQDFSTNTEKMHRLFLDTISVQRR